MKGLFARTPAGLKYGYTCFIILLLLPCLQYGGGKKQITFKQVYEERGRDLFNPLPFFIAWSGDDAYYEIEKGKLIKTGTRGGQSQSLFSVRVQTFVDDETVDLDLLNNIHRTPDYKRFLFERKGDIYLYDRGDGLMTRLTETRAIERNPHFSPDGSAIAYTSGGNLFLYRIETGKTKQLTFDGGTFILNGYASWIYYEEVLGRGSRYKAFYWGPNSRNIVFLRFDQEQVPVFPIFRQEGTYGSLEKQFYPKPGHPNPLVSIGIVDTQSGRTRWIRFDKDPEHYLAFPMWNKKGDRLYLQWLNRAQQDLKIFCIDLADSARYDESFPGKRLSEVYHETQKTWGRFLKNGDIEILDGGGLLIRSPRSGWYHIYHITKAGKLLPITSGEWSVNRIERVVESKRLIYFTAAKEDSTETDLYRTGFNGKKIKRLTLHKGTHSVEVSPGGLYFIDKYSSINIPGRMELRNGNGKHIRLLGDSASKAMQSYSLAKQEIFRIPTADGYRLPAVWYLPPGFDKTKKYPVLFAVYGGPTQMSVKNRFSSRRGIGHFFMPQLGMIVLTVDHRGAGHHGKRGMDMMYKNLGKWEMHDYIETVKYLRTLPFVDSERIAITGGSYGGYVTILALASASEYFKYGVSGAPVTDWSLYDSTYTERYMSTPSDNPEGYRKASVFTYIKNLENGCLRLTHGTIDDNVHLQNTLQLLHRLQLAGKSIQLMLYPGERHTFRSKRNLRKREEIAFWIDKLKLPRPAEGIL
ncbi:MAG: prolyl oligopeptidase family serine peptidase [bacterium]|nr:prolyl oligopeptidase family serine peptidase [bacterium]